MGKKDNESQNGFFKFSENLTESMGPVFGWIWKHGFVILMIIAVIGFIWRSIFHHYVDGMVLSESLSVAFVEIITIFVVILLIGVAAFLCLKIVAAVLKTIGQRNAQKRAAIETQSLNPEVEQKKTIEEVKIDTAILKAYLTTRRMTTPYGDEGKTVFDKLVAVLMDMLKLYKKGGKSEMNYSDKDFIQIATTLYNHKYQNTQKSAFNAWCRSFFKALGLEEPKDIKKTKKEDFEARITELMDFLPGDDFA